MLPHRLHVVLMSLMQSYSCTLVANAVLCHNLSPGADDLACVRLLFHCRPSTLELSKTTLKRLGERDGWK